MKDINRVFGERLFIARRARRLTREELSELVGISPRFLADVEYGKAGVSLTNLAALCRALSVSANFLLGLEPLEDSDARRELISAANRLPERLIPYAVSLLKVLEAADSAER